MNEGFETGLLKMAGCFEAGLLFKLAIVLKVEISDITVKEGWYRRKRMFNDS